MCYNELRREYLLFYNKTMRTLLVSTLIFFFVPLFSHAADTIPLLVNDLPFIGSSTNLAELLQGIFRLTLGIAVTATVFIIVFNGIRYMLSDVIGKKEDALAWIRESLWGLILAFSVVLILNTINPDLTKFDFLTSLRSLRVDTSTEPPGGGGGNEPPESDTPPDGSFTYKPGIAAQRGHASPALETLLQCMAVRVPGNVGLISSISDSKITSGTYTFEYCTGRGNTAPTSTACAHRAGSLHYGGRTCVGSSYAVDFADQENASALINAAHTCLSGSYAETEGNHVHVSLSGVINCGSTD